MNVKFFIGDFGLLLFFVSQGRETHDSEGSFIEILLPFLISIALIIGLLYRIGFITVDNNPEHVKSLRVWVSAIAIGALIRFIIQGSFEPLFFLVVVSYTIAFSGTMRIIHKLFY